MRAWAWTLAACVACAGESADFGGATPDGGTAECFSANECPTGWSCSQFGTCVPPADMSDGGTPPPAEVEREFGPPTHTLRYVYVNMPDLDALAKIDGATLSVSSVPVGDRPEVVATIPGSDDALVLDRGSATVSIVRPTVDRDDKITLRTLPHLNVLTVEEQGRWAVAWFDLTQAVADAGGIAAVGDEVGSFQDVTLIALGRGEEQTIDLSVGFRPREVEFDAAAARAFVVTDDGVSVIDLAEAAAGGATVRAAVPVTPDPLLDPATVEVEITPNGERAVARPLGQAALYLTSLADGTVRTVSLASEATDVDLLPDGRRVLAILREARQAVFVDVDTGAIDSVELGGLPLAAPLGSAAIDAAGRRALLYTNAAELERVVALDLEDPAHPLEVWPLEKGVRAVAFAPDGEKALVLHSKAPGDPLATTDVDEFIDRSYGYSVLHLASGFAKLRVTPVDPGAFAFTPDARDAYLTLDGGDAEGATTRLEIIDLATFVVREVELGSPPESVGVLPTAGVVFVSQRHPMGRVTFLELGTDARRTVTGFELNSHIID
jgi:DNA-binding beta-propeller fold protein YncE